MSNEPGHHPTPSSVRTFASRPLAPALGVKTGIRAGAVGPCNRPRR